MILAVAGSLLIAATGCKEAASDTASQEGGQLLMPDVVGQRLDHALDAIKDAGFDDDVDIIGGGTFRCHR
jgi:hypothetical protein